MDFEFFWNRFEVFSFLFFVGLNDYMYVIVTIIDVVRRHFNGQKH
jgi:hypothetical protein